MTKFWRLIRTDIFSAFENMAIDHVLLDACHKGTGTNTVRFYRWSPSAVSIGRFQDIEEEVNLEACKERKIDVVRRISSGGAVYHDHDGELTYSIICQNSASEIPTGVIEIYKHLCQGLLQGLRILGVHGKFASGSERFCPNLFVKKRKISGNAQSRRGNTLLQHGTILRILDLRTMFTVLRIFKTEPTVDRIQRAAGRLTSLEKELGKPPAFERIEEALINGLSKALPARFYEEPLTPAELQSAKTIAKSWYGNSDWTFKRGLSK